MLFDEKAEVNNLVRGSRKRDILTKKVCEIITLNYRLGRN
jgi:hypothetical protein